MKKTLKYKKTKQNKTIINILKIISILLGIFFLVITLIMIYTNIVFLTDKTNLTEQTDKEIKDKNNLTEQTDEKIKKEDIDKGKKIKVNNINLNNYNSNINISNEGEYNITGEFKHSIIVDSDKKVTLNLNNVTINSTITAAIANINSGELVINLENNSTNILKDSGFSEYNSCLYSKGKLTIEGTGILKIYGNQKQGEGIATRKNDITINGGDIYIESTDDGINAGGKGGVITINNGNIFIKASGDGIDSNRDLIINGGIIYTIGSSTGGDAAIDTDDKFEINGGDVIALGTDMLKNPDDTSKQKSVSFTLDSKIISGSDISLKDSSENEIIAFKAEQDFKTLIISNTNLSNNTYYLYINGEETQYRQSIK